MGIKKLLFMYVEKARGFRQQEFNFSTGENFQVKRKEGSFFLNWKKEECRKKLPEGFWKPNIMEISLLIGENGSGKTTVMQMICHWIEQLSRGYFPQEEGLLVFREDDTYGYVGFSGGRKKRVSINNPKLTPYSEKMLMTYFRDVKLVYFSNTMTDLNLENSKILANHSMPQRLKEAWKESGFLNEDIIADYKRYELKRRYEGKKVYNKQINSMLDEKSALTYVQLKIDHSTFDELEELLPQQYQDVGQILSELWEGYFTNINEEIENLIVELLRTVFIGIIKKMIKWETNYTITGEQGVTVGILGQMLLTEKRVGENSILVGGEWIRSFLKNLLYEWREGYLQNKNITLPYHSWTDNISDYMDSFLKMILSYLDNEVLLNNEQIELMLADEKKSILQIRLDEQNADEFERFWEAYEKITFYVENICLEWNASSGEANRASLYAILSEISEDSNYIWFLLDEPDNTFHLEWKRHLMEEFVDICGGQDKMIQAWISTHSPIMLSDVPGTSVIYLKAVRDDDGKIIGKQVCERPFIDTFGQNIYVLFNHAFFLENGVIGTFANGKILEALQTLKNVEERLRNQQNKDMNYQDDIKRCEMLIDLVAEPVFKKYMQQYLLKCKKMGGVE